MIEIGIVDTRNIVKTIQDTYGFDLSNYALTSLKRRLEKIISLHNLKHADSLINKLKYAPDYIGTFLKDFGIQGTEMFRDPSMWRWIRDNYFAEMMQIDSNYKIWLPDCVSGDELYTLCILLKESNLLDTVQVHATCTCKAHEEAIKTGDSHIKKIETSTENYKRYNAMGDFSEYYTNSTIQTKRNTSLISNVQFEILDIQKDRLPRQVDMILYRNHFVYFNQTLQDELTKRLMDCLKIGGLFIIGNKEVMGRQFLNDFVFINHAESVYKKR